MRWLGSFGEAFANAIGVALGFLVAQAIEYILFRHVDPSPTR